MTLLQLNSRDTSFSEPSGQNTITDVGTNKFIKRYCLTASEKHEARLSIKLSQMRRSQAKTLRITKV